jgi:hypothetical protein
MVKVIKTSGLNEILMIMIKITTINGLSDILVTMV